MTVPDPTQPLTAAPDWDFPNMMRRNPEPCTNASRLYRVPRCGGRSVLGDAPTFNSSSNATTS